MRLLYLVLLASFGAQAGSSFALGKDLLAAMDAHSRAANLRPLRNSRQDELRIWAHDYMGARITGYVISKDGSIRCQTSYVYADGLVSIQRAKCRSWHIGQDVLAELDAISALDGKEWNCPMLDGGGFYIEGVHNQKRFALSVGNPDACNDHDSKVVVDLLRKL